MNKKKYFLRATLASVLVGLVSNVWAITSNYHVNANRLSPLGINTNEALEVDSSMPFTDLFRLALPFDEARPWFTKGNVRFDKNGWPANLNGGQAGTRFLSHIPPKAVPPGRYTVLYEGQGEITYGASAKLVKRLKGKDIIEFKPMPDGNITASMFIKTSNPRNYIRNIKVLMPGGICRGNKFQRVHSARSCRNNTYMSFEKHHQRLRFNPEYLNFMKDFKVLRFMNMGGITRNNLRSWHQRPTLTKATWGGKEGVRGVPIEVMVDLANTLNANPWFNIPHNADDGFIQRYAQYVKKHLRPHLKVHLEYTNEAWNDVFVPQAEHMKQTGMRRRLDSDRRIAGWKFYSMQSVHVFKQWERVFGGKKRLMRIIGGLNTDTQMSHTILGYRNAYKHIDALAVAPYFHIPQDKIKSIRSVHQVFQHLNDKKNRYSIDNTLNFVRKQSEIAKTYGVHLIAYEGGQHLVQEKTHSNTEGATPFLIKANKHPMMQRAYQRLLLGWKQAGGNLFVAFSSPRSYTWHGSWGIKEYINEPNHFAPKYRALMSFNRSNRCWWAGCTSSVVSRLTKPARIASHLAQGKAPPPPPPNSVKIRKQGKSRNAKHSASAQRVATVINGTITDPRDLSAAWRSSWDEKNLYVWVDINDDRQVKDSHKPWADDSVEIYIDADGSRRSSYDGKNDFQLTYRMNDAKLSVSNGRSPQYMRGVTHRMVRRPNGYQLETAIPWAALKVKPGPGRKVGFDIQINDDDTGNMRDAKLAWNATEDKAWKNPQMFGQLVLSH